MPRDPLLSVMEKQGGALDFFVFALFVWPLSSIEGIFERLREGFICLVFFYDICFFFYKMF